MEDTIIQEAIVEDNIINALTAGDTLQHGKYVIQKILGQGGFGITYLAQHRNLNKLVAIKEFFPHSYCNRDTRTQAVTIGTPSSRELIENLKLKFIKEAKFLASMRDENIVSVHDVFEEHNTAYFVMDYIDGVTLSQMIKSKGTLPEEEALRYIRSICTALKAVHSRNINHLDIKPANIMIRRSDDRAILIDFGASKQYDNAGDETTSMMPSFSMGYAPIEQYTPGGVASFSPSTDIYALGATLYAALTGKHPPHYSTIMEKGLPALPKNISSRTANAIKWAMSARRQDRPSDVTAFEKALSKPIKPSGSGTFLLAFIAAIIGGCAGYALEYFFGPIIFDELGLPPTPGTWLIPIVLGVIGVILLFLCAPKSRSKKKGLIVATCFALFAAAGAAACEVIDPKDTTDYYSNEYPIYLSGDLIIDNCTAVVGISDDLYPHEDFTITMSKDNEFIVQNSEGYVKCRYSGSTSDGYGSIDFYDIESGEFNGEHPDWLDAVSRLLGKVRSWDSRNEMATGNMAYYFYNADDQTLIMTE
ncbi:MAG: serine/threonine protein kinase [Muribaculaceae bacterium]|nr:serine/threonine protein kinase [Muribaculaceae bacterium]